MTRQRIALIASALYLLGGAIVLGTFLMAPPLVLASIRIAAWTLPVTLFLIWQLYGLINKRS